MPQRLLIFITLLLVCSWSSAAEQSAEEIIRSTTSEVLSRITTDREEYQARPERLQSLVRELITPHFDFEIMSKQVLEQYWNQLKPEQQDCFVSGFGELLVKRYSHILNAYDNQTIRLEPEMPTDKPGYVMVKQILSKPGRPPLPIVYPFRELEDGWKAVDLVIDNISLVTSYRQSFLYDINQQGLETFLSSICP